MFLVNLIPTLIYSQNWKIVPEIEEKRDIILKGKIANKYDITMCLRMQGGVCGFEEYAVQWRNRELQGWYYYDNIKAKIPLIGYFNGSDNFEFRKEDEPYDYKYLELFVPANYFNDTINKKDCTVPEYSEKFYNDKEFDFRFMKWKKGKTELPVIMEVVHNIDLVTKARFIIYINGFEMSRLNISDLTKLKYIEYLELHDVKDTGDYIHITFDFYERTIPGGSGGGYCGAGVETFIGYLRLNKDWSINKFEFKQVHSCRNWNKVENYKIIKGKPELGLVKTND